MAFDVNNIRAIVFDYGNTIIPFGREALDAYDQELAAGLRARFGAFDEARFQSFRMESRLAPYAGDPPSYRENDFASITVGLIRALYGITPEDEVLAELLALRLKAFVDVVSVEPDVDALLGRLGERYALGLLSNYPDGEAIRMSLETTGLARHFDAVVISGEEGYVKPHPVVFEKMVECLAVAPPEVLFVGDNWLADVQGAKRAGMRAAHMRRWAPPEVFEAGPEDFLPDFEIADLSELEAVLETPCVAEGERI